MSISGEKLASSSRKGFSVGIAVSELMLLVLFVLLLFFLDFKNNSDSAIADIGGKDTLDLLRQNDLLVQILRSKPQEFENWLRLTLGDDFMEALDNPQLDDISNLVEEEKQKNEIFQNTIKEQNELIDAIKEEYISARKKGGTTLCTNTGLNTEQAKLTSLPLGSVALSNEGITLLQKGFDKESILDEYGEPYDPSEALAQIEDWDVGAMIDYENFSVISRELSRIGDKYASEIRENCRFYFNFYFDELDSRILNRWNTLNYGGLTISNERYLELSNTLSP
jgi:hypothetical protein